MLTSRLAGRLATAPYGRARLAWPGTRQALPALVWLGLLAGTVLVAYAYAYAATVFDTQLQFHLFWIGELLFVVPASIRLCMAGASRAERLAIVAATGLFDFLPKFLRDPQGPLYFDEIAHWRQSEVIFQTGKLFQPNPIVPIIQYFPGLHALTVALRDLSGLSTFQLGVLLLASFHVLALLGIFLIAERMSHSAVVGGIAAFIYSLSPGFMFFNSQYAYESMAIVLFIWVLAAVVMIQDARGGWWQQMVWFVVGLLLAAGCIVTHHLSSYVMTAVLALVATVTILRRRQHIESRFTILLTLAFALLVLAGTLLWLVLVAPGTISYITPKVFAGVQQVLLLLQHKQQSRTLFANSTFPGYERIFAFVSPVIAAAGVVARLWLLRRRQRQRRPYSSAVVAILLFGLLYFPSAPLMLTQSGSEVARRSWAYSYIGLSLLLAPVIPWLLQRVKTWRLQLRGAVAGGISTLLSIMLIGNVAADLNGPYRFPGPYIYGSDTNSLTPELVQATDWLRQTQGPGQIIVADRYNGEAFAAFGMDQLIRPWPGFPIWQLYFSAALPSATLLQQLQHAHIRYMIIDKRMPYHLPYINIYFVNQEPRHTTPPPAAAINKYVRLPWAIKIYESDNLQIYRLNFAAVHLQTSLAQGGASSTGTTTTATTSTTHHRHVTVTASLLLSKLEHPDWAKVARDW